MPTPEKIVSKAGFPTVTLNEDPSYLFFKRENFGIPWKDSQVAFAKAEKTLVDRGITCIVSDVDVMQRAYSLREVESLVRALGGSS